MTVGGSASTRVRILLAAALLLGVAGGGLAAALLLTAGGSAAEAAGVPSPSATSAPSWLVKKAAKVAAQWGDADPTDAYWGLLRDPELGRLTFSGPDDPSHALYVIVLAGDYSKAGATASFLGPRSSPPSPIKWILRTNTLARAVAGIVSLGTSRFDAARYPSLHPLVLSAAATSLGQGAEHE